MKRDQTKPKPLFRVLDLLTPDQLDELNSPAPRSRLVDSVREGRGKANPLNDLIAMGGRFGMVSDGETGRFTRARNPHQIKPGAQNAPEDEENDIGGIDGR